MNKILYALAALATAGAAQASIIPTLQGNPTNVGGGMFRYDYSATLAADQGLVTGGYFTLYDVSGFSSFGSLPSGFTGSTSLLGKTPGDVLPTDSASVLNVSFTYSGPAINYATSGNVSTELGTFSIFSSAGNRTVLHDFTSSALKNSGEARGTSVSTIGKAAVEVPGAATVPEPATWGLMITGFGMIGIGMRRRSRNVVTA
nr:PEPxxWA-CTERM sorting domain-containing protein [Polymorphobacter sp.]